MTQEAPDRADLDIMEMPAKALAAYWLSLKKLMDSKKGAKVVQEEMAVVTEPSIRLLLETAFGSGLSEDAVRRLMTVGRRRILEDVRRKLDCMTRTLLGMATGENPQRLLTLLTALFPVPPIREKAAMDRVYVLLEKAKAVAAGVKPAPSKDGAGQDGAEEDPAAVSLALLPEILLVRLLYCLAVVRREGRDVCRRLATSTRSLFFAEGLGLVADNFDETFLRERLTLHRRALLDDAALKLVLCEEMCLGLRNRYSYEDLWRLARAHLPR